MRRDTHDEILGAAWRALSASQLGCCLLAVLELAGARIEVGGPERILRVTSHGASRAARGAPPGRRISAMGIVPGPDGAPVRMSIGLVLRLSPTALVDEVIVRSALAWHAAVHADELRRLPAGDALRRAVDAVTQVAGEPGSDGREAWAWACVDQVEQEVAAAPARVRLA